MQVQINGKSIDLKVKSDESVALRVAAHIERRVKEDDWLPYKNKQDALSAWRKLGGIRVKVLEAYDTCWSVWLCIPPTLHELFGLAVLEILVGILST